MAAVRPKVRNDPFIQQDPNKSRYSQRLTTEQWSGLKPMITDLLDQGVRVVDVLRRLDADDIHVTRSQLETQMKKWDAPTNTEEQHQQTMPSSPDTSTSGIRLLESTPDESHADTLSSASTAQMFQARDFCEELDACIDTSLEETTYESRLEYPPQGLEHHSHALVDLPVSFKCTSLEKTRPEPQPARFPPQISEYHPKALPDPSVFSSLLFEQRDSPKNPAVSQAHHSTPTVHSMHSSTGSASVSTLLASKTTRRPFRVPSYPISDTIRNLQGPPLLESGLFSVTVLRLCYMAALLLNLRCFNEAFEVFYLILRGLSDPSTSYEITVPRLLFSVTGCIRCASTEQQIVVARVLDQQLDKYLEACLEPDRWIGKPQSRFIQPLLRLAQVIRSLRHASVAPGLESLRENAYLAAYGTVLGLENETLDISKLIVVPSFVPETVLQSFCESQDVRKSIVEALDTMRGCLRYRAREIKQLLDETRSVHDISGFEMRQTLAFYVLEYHNDNSLGAFSHVSESLKTAEHSQFFCLLQEHALAALPFLLMGIMEDPGLLQESEEQAEPPLLTDETSNPQRSQDSTGTSRSISPISSAYGSPLNYQRSRATAGGIKMAMIKIQQALHLAPESGGYRKLIQVLLGHMSPCARGPILLNTSSNKRLVNLAIKMARLEWTKPGIGAFSPSISLLRLPLPELSGTSTLPKLPPSSEAPDEPDLPRQPPKTPTNIDVAITTDASDSGRPPAEQDSTRDSSYDPPIAGSLRSSISSAFRSFKGLSVVHPQNRSTSNLSVHTTSTGKRSGPMSWRFSVVTGLSSNPSVRGSTATDVTMGGIEEETSVQWI
ncbi:hypothetical protein H2200_006204 [Cladophialophora chaetospira]|uniref:Clr5 domain-containing protein n=1 Tax=Cladophialophora chaetospira TaxID=386627 RepID=A0AA38XAP9_9EURO|nr:hypothetical protein H2200_006204 [Cladophialophora chaetospira]